jgi:ABC-type histidine transport system ATPase subunit
MKNLAAEGYTMVVVTHEMDFARQVSDEVVFLERIADREGLAREVLYQPGLRPRA